jgi:hypothetical protein
MVMPLAVCKAKARQCARGGTQQKAWFLSLSSYRPQVFAGRKLGVQCTACKTLKHRLENKANKVLDYFSYSAMLELLESRRAKSQEAQKLTKERQREAKLI